MKSIFLRKPFKNEIKKDIIYNRFIGSILVISFFIIIAITFFINIYVFLLVMIFVYMPYMIFCETFFSSAKLETILLEIRESDNKNNIRTFILYKKIKKLQDELKTIKRGNKKGK